KFHFSFEKFIFFTEKHLIFIDDSFKESFSVDIHNIELSLDNIDSANHDAISHLSVSLNIDKYGSFKMLDAELNPLSKRPNLKGIGKVIGLDMRMLAPMTKQYIGHNIKSGQLDVDLKLNINQGVIDSNLGLALHQFELKTLSNEEAKALDSEFGFPLNSSLSLLRDSDNTIYLDIPFTGDIESPEFDPRDAIVTASSKAITAAVIHYYTPFGLVFAAESLFDLATALNFDPIIFKHGESKLDAAHNEQLDKLATLMTERPGIHLTICGFSNNMDKDKLFPAAEKSVSITLEQKTPVKPEPAPLSKENIAVLKKLAETRSNNVKKYMVNKKTIESSRLIECAPEYSPDEISVVEISI
ncbi:MAG: DUF748 domain-containing protein, partial [Gammaproteobacteria bacterium]|nr:DUF748 domain-containing protein [Gammaproteobacteria bacterium]